MVLANDWNRDRQPPTITSIAVTVERKVKNESLVHSECTSRSEDRLVREILLEIYMVVIFPTVVMSTCAHP